MYTTTNEDGILNNYPNETKPYYAQYPAIWEQRKYVVQAIFAASFVTAVVLVAFVAS